MQAEDGPTRSVPRPQTGPSFVPLPGFCESFVARYPQSESLAPMLADGPSRCIYPHDCRSYPPKEFPQLLSTRHILDRRGGPPSLIRLECVSSTFDYSQNAVPSQHVDAACRPRKQSRVSGADLDSSLATTTPAPVCEICLGRYAQAKWKKMAFLSQSLVFRCRIEKIGLC